MTMQALVYHSPRELCVEAIERPRIGKDELLIRVAFCGVCGTDLHIFNGEGGSYEVSPPLVMGHEFSGYIEEIGAEVSGFSIADLVTIDPNDMCGRCYFCKNGEEQFCQNAIGYGTTRNGGFAEYCVVSAKQVFPFHSAIDPIIAAMAEPLSCCLHGIDLCNIRPGDEVIIIGAGPIGLMMLQLAKLSGAGKLILSEPIAQKRALAKTLGADLCIDPLQEDVQAILSKECKNPRVVIECVGRKNTIEDAIAWAGKAATVLMFGLTGADARISVSPDLVFKKELRLTSSFINPYTFERAVLLLQAGKLQIKELITDIIPLERAAEVFENDAYRQRGKVMIQLSAL